MSEGFTIRPETEQEREQRHRLSLEAYRKLVDPENPPREPFVIEHHFFATDSADVTGFTTALEERGFHIETFAYNPDDPVRTWVVVAIKIDILEERRILALSDELDALGREYDVNYDGWLTHVE